MNLGIAHGSQSQHFRVIRKKREKIQINEIRNEKGELTIDTTEIQKIIRDYYRKQSANKMDKLGKNGQILRKVQPSKTEPGRNRKHEQTNQKK